MNIEQWLYSFPVRLRSLFRSDHVDDEMKEELREHLDRQIRENVARGMAADEARRLAVRAMGGMTQIEQQCRDARRVHIEHQFLKDLRDAYRQLQRTPGFSVLAILC